MRIRRGLLFWGLFLIPLGGLPLLARSGAVDPSRFADAWRLWPLVLVALGVALLLGRYRAGTIGVAVAALVLGSLAGGSLASGSLWFGSIGDCAGRSTDTAAVEDDGTFSGDAELKIDIDCGTVDLSTTPAADGWSVHADYRGSPPVITATGSTLAIGTPDGGARHHQDWTVTVPATQLSAVDVQANAGTTSLDLAGANLTRVQADVNAVDLRIDAGAAMITRLAVSLNAGRARITLGAGRTTGQLSANAGAIELCVPPGASLRLQVQDQLTFAHNLDDLGLTRDGDTWTRLGGVGEIDLTVEGNAASFTLDPDGGCK